MPVKRVIVEYIVPEVDTAVAFYQRILDCTLVAEEKEGEQRSWALLEKQGFQLSFKAAHKIDADFSYMKGLPIGGTVSLVLEVEDINAAYAELRQKCELLSYPHLTACGQTEFSLKDPHGYFITFEMPNPD